MKKNALIIALFAVLALPAYAETNVQADKPTSLSGLFGQKKSKFLPVHQAFGVSASQDGDKVVVRFAVTPEHYVYEDKLSLSLPEGVTASAWQFSQKPTTVDDPEFGRVAVFETDVVATAVLTSKTDLKDENIRIKWQGCAKAGLCYPPETVNVAVNLTAKNADKSAQNTDTGNTPQPNQKSEPKSHQTTQPVKPKADKVADKNKVQDETQPNDKPSPLVQAIKEPSAKTNDDGITSPSKASLASEQDAPNVANDTLADNTQSTTTLVNDVDDGMDNGEADVFQTDSATVVNVANTADQTPSSTSQVATPTNALTHTTATSDPFGVKNNPVWALVLLFLAGLVLSLTPCVYPMIPIVANIVARGQGQTTAKKGLALSSSYGLGVATAYGTLGAVVAWFGQAIGITTWLQNPYVLGVFALIFAVLGVAMFDVIRFRLPSFISNRLQNQAQKGDDKLGSLGGSFVAGGLSALVVSPCVSLPMAGALTAVSASGSVGFGFLALFLFGLGLSLPLMVVGAVQGKFMPKAGEWMNRVKEFCGLLLLAVAVSLLERMIFTPIMLIIWAGWFGAVAVWFFKIGKLPTQTFGLLSGIWTVILMVGASMGNTDAWRPLANTHQVAQISTQKADVKITTLNELDEVLTKHDKVLVDITAEWCIECRIMERTLFTNRPAVLGDYQVVKLDITETTDASRAVLARYQLFGPPALIIYQNGQLKEVLLGEVKRSDFEMALAKY
ncbi:cytochrome c biogenesis protein CcdA [Moraxella oblonga]|uniref:cytochrome c biogenesis protein CcdA n=1 Tax=Moraxella oblonga TaxID=200413 RepID=UPI00082BE23B|nr:protein-disulfide reductase DsbD domain-containing protein [Moraxella oblonga]